MMAEEKPEEEMDVRKEDLLLSFYDALMDYDAHKDIMAFQDRLIDQAIMNGYDDATRQGAFYAVLDKRYPLQESEKLREAAKSAKVKAKGLIVERIKVFLTLSGTNSTYNDWHKKLCVKVEGYEGSSLMEIYNDENLDGAFTAGNAQKWVNMTMKYLYVYATILSEMKEFSNCNPLQNIIAQSENFHVPLDSIVLKAVFREEMRNSINMGDSPLIKETELINWIESEVSYTNRKTHKTEHNGVNSEGAFVAKVVKYLNKGETDTKKMVEPVTWSKIGTYGAYEKIQEAVKACIPSEYKERPLEWENKVWLAFSKVKPGN